MNTALLRTAFSTPAGSPLATIFRVGHGVEHSFSNGSLQLMCFGTRKQSSGITLEISAELPASFSIADLKVRGRKNCRTRSSQRTGVVSLRTCPHLPRARAVASDQETISAPPPSLRYTDVVFDMDGTMTVSNIDFVEMRRRTGIPQGDLFTVMEAWEDAQQFKDAYAVILEMEAQACLSLALMPGLVELLELLRERGARMALVTRNTTLSVDAFFAKLGEQWRDDFSIILTREFKYVKPDKRLLLHVAQEWDAAPASLLMVGDSREDVECGNAAGTATCLVQGGGNEVSNSPTPSGAEPTYAVTTLLELKKILLGEGSPASAAASAEGSPQQGVGEAERTATSGGSGASRAVAGLDFADVLFAAGIIRGAFCSYPRLAGAAGGLSASTYPGDKLLHLGCGDGGLTKLLASQGLRVDGVDTSVDAIRAATARGLSAKHLLANKGPNGAPVLRKDSLGKDRTFDAVVSCTATSSSSASASASASASSTGSLPWSAASDANEIWRVLRMGGHYACEHTFVSAERSPAGATASPAGQELVQAAQATLRQCLKSYRDRGFGVTLSEVVETAGGARVRFVVEKPGLQFLDMNGPLFGPSF